MSDVSSVVQRTTDFVNSFAEGAERVGDLFSLANRAKEKFLSAIPFKFEASTGASLRATAARFGDAITSVNIPRSVSFGWGDAALLALGVVATFGLGGGIIAFAGWRVGSLAITGLALLACNTGSDSPFIPKPPVINDGGMVNPGSPDLRLPVMHAKNFAYIASAETGNLLEINTQTNIPNNFPIANVSDHAFGIAVTSKRAYVANGSVYVVDTSIMPKSLIAKITSVCQKVSIAAHVAVTPDEKKAYVSCSGLILGARADGSELNVIDTVTNRVTAMLTTYYFGRVGGSGALAVSPNNQKLYVTNYADVDDLTVIDTATDSVVASIKGVYGNAFEGGVAVTPDSRKVYVTEAERSTVQVIDADANKISATIPVGKRPIGIVITPDIRPDPDIPSGYRAYVANHYDNTISVINTATETVIATIPVSGKGPAGLSLTSDGRKLYVTYYNSPFVTVIDTYSHKILGELPVASSFASGQFISPELP